ncbi:MAG: hypothetical protein V3U27_22155 [Candidatus Tectomicrobia bacterium]
MDALVVWSIGVTMGLGLFSIGCGVLVCGGGKPKPVGVVGTAAAADSYQHDNKQN